MHIRTTPGRTFVAEHGLLVLMRTPGRSGMAAVAVCDAAAEAAAKSSNVDAGRDLRDALLGQAPDVDAVVSLPAGVPAYPACGGSSSSVSPLTLAGYSL